MIYRSHARARGAVSAAAIATLLVFAMVLPCSAQQKITVSQATSSMAYIPFYIAQTKGYFKDEGLDVSVVIAGGGPKALAALLSNSVEFALGGATDQINAYKRGQRDVRVVGSIMKGLALAVVMQKDVAAKLGITEKTPLAQRVAAMRGKKVSMTTPGSITDTYMRMLFRSQNLEPDKDVSLVPVGTADSMLAALRTGTLEVCSCALPLNIVSITEGYGAPLVDGREFEQYRELLFTSVYTTQQTIEKNPKLVESFVRALTKAAHLVATDPAAAKEATRPFFTKMKPEIFDASWAYILPSVPTKLEVTQTAIDQLFAFFEAAKTDMGAPPPFKDLVDMSFAQRAETQVK